MAFLWLEKKLNSSDLVTVLIPVFNAESYVAESIASIQCQSYDNLEILVIDDGSTDNSSQIVSKIKDKRIRLVRASKNQGLIATLNMGIELAKGTFIARLDADDFSNPKRIELQLKAFKESEVGLVCSNMSTIVGCENQSSQGWGFSCESLYYNLNLRQCIGHSSVMFKKALVERVGKYDRSAELVEDYDLWSRLIRVSKIKYLQEDLTTYRVLEESISHSNEIEQSKNAKNISLKRLSEIGISSGEIIYDFYHSGKISYGDELIESLNQYQENLMSSVPEWVNTSRLKAYLKYENAIISRRKKINSDLFLFKPIWIHKIFSFFYIPLYRRNMLHMLFLKKEHFL